MTPAPDFARRDGELIAGIDLGTTNSSIAFLRDGEPWLVPVDDSPLLPSVVGLAPDGRLLVGAEAHRQYVLYPERTVRSVKRRMGEDVSLPLGDRAWTPVELSAMILRRLKEAAESAVGEPVQRAVITVPAYFSDAQRTATREAGRVAGLTVEHLLHEPTAASLCYQPEDDRERRVLVYDLGGGTFDVSIVRSSGELTEVLASHGDTHLGGDDFDRVVADRLQAAFAALHPKARLDDPRTQARLLRTAEEARLRLSSESFARVIEEHLVTHDGVPLHLDLEFARHELESLVRPLLERAHDSVNTALSEARVRAKDLDDILLVGGTTRTPLVSDLLRNALGLEPRRDVNPERVVAMGAALYAGRLCGTRHGRLLVDVTPFSFGTSYLGLLEGTPSPHCYKPVIRRNTPLPTRQTEVFYTVVDGQAAVDVHVYQGEDADARQNTEVGLFHVKDLDPDEPEGSPLHFEMRLGLDGILEVEVTEKLTGKKKKVSIENALRGLSNEQMTASRDKLQQAWSPAEAAPSTSPSTTPRPPSDASPEQRATWTKARSLLEKAERVAPTLPEVDRAELAEATGRLEAALAALDWTAVLGHSNEVADVLFFLE